jgi:hypothetical protein
MKLSGGSAVPRGVWGRRQVFISMAGAALTAGFVPVVRTDREADCHGSARMFQKFNATYLFLDNRRIIA